MLYFILQYQYLGILRAFFFHVIESLTIPSDLAYRFKLSTKKASKYSILPVS
jgi:hypothetical protein